MTQIKTWRHRQLDTDGGPDGGLEKAMTHDRSDARLSAIGSRFEPAGCVLRGRAGAIWMAVALVMACGSSDSRAGVSSRTLGNDGSTDSGLLPESRGSSDAATLSNFDGSAESSDSGSIDPSATDAGVGGASVLDARGSASGGDSPTDGGADEPSTGEEAGTEVPSSFFARYEAESALNTRSFPVEGVVTDAAQPCPGVPGTGSDGVKEGADCASGGRVVNEILGRSPCTPPTSTTSYTDCGNQGGGVTFNGVAVPVDGRYDVTFGTTADS
jgi:hypothetical protein